MNTQNVSAAKGRVGGAAYMAPLGTTLPTNATDQLGAEFKDLGFVSEDGLSNDNSPTTTDIKDWTGSIILSPMSERPDKYKVKFMESTNLDTLKLIYGDENVSGTFETGIHITAKPEELENHAFVFDMAINGGLKRIVISNGKLSSLGTINYKPNDATAFEVDIAAMPDSAGATHHDYTVKKS